jgi:signal transduction histidine kinase
LSIANKLDHFRIDRTSWILLIISLVLFATAILFDFARPSVKDQLANRASEIQAKVNERVDRLVTEVGILATGQNFPGGTALPAGLYLYRHGRLVKWGDNRVLPYEPISDYEEGVGFAKLRNGYFIVVRQTTGEHTAIGLLPVYYDYAIENAYLKNEFASDLEVPEGCTLSLQHEDGMVPISHSGSPLFSIESGNQSDSGTLPVVLTLWLVAIFTFSAAVHRFARSKSKEYGVVIVILTIFLVQWVLLPFIPGDITVFEIFGPYLYGSADIAHSLGDLLIGILQMIWLLIFWTRRPIRLKEGWIRFLGAGVVSYLSSVLGERIIRSLVLDSQMSLNVGSFEIFNIYSFLGLLTVALVFACMFLIFRATQVKDLPVAKKLPALVGLGLVAFILGWVLEWRESALIAIIWTTLVLAAMSRLSGSINDLVKYTTVLFWLVCFSALGAILMDGFLQKKQVQKMRLMARELADERDPVLEFLFQESAASIIEDEFLSEFVSDALIPKAQIDSRLSALYLDGYLNRYDFRSIVYNAEGAIVKGVAGMTNLASVRHLIQEFGEETGQPGLYRIDKPGDRNTYMLDLPIGNVGTLIVYLAPSKLTKKNVYPELLLDQSVSRVDYADQFNYAVYKNGKLASNKGDYDYPGTSQSFETDEEYYLTRTTDHEHLTIQPAPEKVVVVSTEKAGNMRFVSMFSYLLCILLLLVLTMWLFDFISHQWNGAPMAISFRSRIHFAMIFIIIFSFLVIGAVTVIYFQDQFDDYHKQRLMRKVNAVSTDLQYMADYESSREDAYVRFMAQLSDVHSIDVNLFDEAGNLLVSSQPKIFERGLVSRKMNPMAYNALQDEGLSKFIHNERIGELGFLAAYVPIIRAGKDKPIYMHLPYFAKEKNLRKDISSFLIALINVYVLLLVGAGLLVLFISDSITQSLRLVGEKLKKVTLGSKIEPISWHGKDEIGALVGEYNKMILELEKSAELLARSERESAWREMAKQVAHEIKNPLTPMKLGIQHLQKAVKSNDPNSKELTERVTNTLIEQIENLSAIASDFSSFAKMPKASKEQVDLRDVVEATTALHRERDDLAVTISMPDQPVWVLADKNQLITVFNNFVTNADQAIPDGVSGTLEVAVVRQGDSWLITITDNGEGIPEDRQDKVFVPNFTTKTSGMGLGLAMVKNIVEESGGQVWFESEVGKGTSFYVELPVNDQDS